VAVGVAQVVEHLPRKECGAVERRCPMAAMMYM
jgi:hypothetical protein